MFINLTSGLKGWHFVLISCIFLGLICYSQKENVLSSCVIIHIKRAPLKGAVWRRGKNANFSSHCYKSTSLWLFISLIICLQCNFNWCTESWMCFLCQFIVCSNCGSAAGIAEPSQGTPGHSGWGLHFFPNQLPFLFVLCYFCVLWVIFLEALFAKVVDW